jgi:high-affinity iron transporter
MVNVFSVEIFFIVFRECLEASVIISVLLSFVKQGVGSNQDPKLYRRLVWQIWIGAASGLLICLAIGGGFIGAFYGLGKDLWSSSEDLWEGIFSIIATVMITFMGLAMLRINKMREKWRLKIARAILQTEDKNAKFKFTNWTKKYALALLPFITTLREGVEAIVFVGGVSLGMPATAFPLAVICGLLAGVAVGYILYRGGNMMSMQYFLIASTCFLYLIAAGLFSRAVWYFENYVYSIKAGGDPSEEGSGPGSYNVLQSVWHVNCCNPETDNGWEIFNALFGWQNSATYGSVISYNIYWLFIMAVIFVLLRQEKTGRLPIIHRFYKKKTPSSKENEQIIRRAEAVAGKKYGGVLQSSEYQEVALGDMLELSSSKNSANQNGIKETVNEV